MKITADPQIKLDAAAAALLEARNKQQLTKRQVIIGMINEGFITETEGMAMAKTGDIPAALSAIIDTMAPLEQTAAKVTVATFTVAYRLDPMTQLFQIAGGLTDEQMDSFFEAYKVV